MILGEKSYLSHDHDLVARQIKLFDSLSEDNFGMPIRVHLTIAMQGKEIKSSDKRKKAHIGCIKSIDSCIITCYRDSSSKPNCDKQDFPYHLRCLDVFDRFFLW